MTEIREWHDINGRRTAYTIRGTATGQDYLVHMMDARFWIYAPGDWRSHGSMEFLVLHAYAGREITARYVWGSHRRARRIVAKAERRVARAMRNIYRANSFTQRQGT